jgi:hypothetical protein
LNPCPPFERSTWKDVSFELASLHARSIADRETAVAVRP